MIIGFQILIIGIMILIIGILYLIEKRQNQQFEGSPIDESNYTTVNLIHREGFVKE